MARKESEGADFEAMGVSEGTKGSRKRGASASASTTPARSTSDTGKKPNGRSDQKSAPKSGASSKADAPAGGRGTRTAGSRATKSANTKGTPDLRKDLRDFAGSRPQGWSHDEWLGFLDDLQARGHNINDRDAIGSMLERERLALALERIPGVGPQRVRSIADRYGYLWRLKETDADQLARETDVPKNVAEKVIEALGS